MHTLSEAARAWLIHADDGFDEDRFRVINKTLRNFSQRLHLPPVERRGRTDFYGLPTLCVLRIAVAAKRSGVTGPDLKALTLWMQQRDKFAPIGEDGKQPTPVAQMMDGLSEGRDFTVRLAHMRDGMVPTLRFADEETDPAVQLGIALSGVSGKPEAVTLIPASDHMRDAVSALTGEAP